MAAAAAIITGKKRKKHYSFETNPSIRKRQATRLLRKLKQLMTEYTTRVGQQACIVVCCPGKIFFLICYEKKSQRSPNQKVS